MLKHCFPLKKYFLIPKEQFADLVQNTIVKFCSCQNLLFRQAQTLGYFFFISLLQRPSILALSALSEGGRIKTVTRITG